MSEYTTSSASIEKCGYCGNWHNYSYEMCRDIHRNKQTTFNILKAFDNLSDETGITHIIVKGDVE